MPVKPQRTGIDTHTAISSRINRFVSFIYALALPLTLALPLPLAFPLLLPLPLPLPPRRSRAVGGSRAHACWQCTRVPSMAHGGCVGARCGSTTTARACAWSSSRLLSSSCRRQLDEIPPCTAEHTAGIPPHTVGILPRTVRIPLTAVGIPATAVGIPSMAVGIPPSTG